METCLECNHKLENRKGLSYHVSQKHGTRFEAYVIKHEHNNEHPTCKCGCGSETKFFGGKFMDYVGCHFHIGREKSSAHRENLRLAMTGLKRSEETKQKMSLSHKKHYVEHPERAAAHSLAMKGVPKSEKHKRKISETRSKRLADGSIVINREKISSTVTNLYLSGGFMWAKGSYTSTKTGKKCHYRSSYELTMMQRFDADESIIDWQYEPFSIPYELDGTQRRYIPDFLVTYVDGKKALIEIKPDSETLRLSPMNVAKQNIAIAYCEDNSIEYVLMSA